MNLTGQEGEGERVSKGDLSQNKDLVRFVEGFLKPVRD